MNPFLSNITIQILLPAFLLGLFTFIYSGNKRISIKPKTYFQIKIIQIFIKTTNHRFIIIYSNHKAIETNLELTKKQMGFQLNLHKKCEWKDLSNLQKPNTYEYTWTIKNKLPCKKREEARLFPYISNSRQSIGDPWPQTATFWLTEIIITD